MTKEEHTKRFSTWRGNGEGPGDHPALTKQLLEPSATESIPQMSVTVHVPDEWEPLYESLNPYHRGDLEKTVINAGGDWERGVEEWVNHSPTNRELAEKFATEQTPPPDRTPIEPTALDELAEGAETPEGADGSEGGVRTASGVHGLADRGEDIAERALEVSAPSAESAPLDETPEAAEGAEGSTEGADYTSRIIESLDLIDIRSVKEKDGTKTTASIRVCPRNPSHDQGSAWLVVTNGGAVKAGCSACKTDKKTAWDWYWLRDKKFKEWGIPIPSPESAKAAETAEGSNDPLALKYPCNDDAHDDEWFADGRLTGAELLAAAADHYARHIVFMKSEDAWYTALWAAQTHAGDRMGTTPRVKVTSPVPGAGKSTWGQHVEATSHKAVKAESFASEASLTAVTATEPRTMILDEFEKAMAGDPAKIQAAMAIINSGYKVGGKRIKTVTDADGNTTPIGQSTFSFTAIVGNAPPLPDDTMERTHTILLMPDWLGRASESTWDVPEFEAAVGKLGRALHLWIEETDLTHRPDLPDGVKGRMREKWLPLARVAHAAGGAWPKRVWDMAAEDVERARRDREEGLVRKAPHIVLLQHVIQDWPEGETFWATEDMVSALKHGHDETWGPGDKFKDGLTATRLAKMLRDWFGIRSEEESSSREARRKGYRHSHFTDLASLLSRSGLSPSEGSELAKAAEGQPGPDEMKDHLLSVAGH